MLVSVDPGVRSAGVAVWSGPRLAAAWLARGEDWWQTAVASIDDVHRRFPTALADLSAAGAIVVERPQVYQQSKWKGDPNDLVTLAIGVGTIFCRSHAKHRFLYKPAEWKGSVPKDVMVKRIQARLSDPERMVVELPRASTLAHNVWDAIGIGLHHLGRIKEKHK